MHEYAYDHIYYCAYDHDDGHVYVHEYHYDRGCVHANFNYSPNYHARHEHAYPFFCDHDCDFFPLYHDNAHDYDHCHYCHGDHYYD